MRANLDLTGGGIMAEAVMMAAAPVLGRDHAHHELIRLARLAVKEGRDLAEVAAADPDFAGALGREGIERALDPAGYLGESGDLARAIAKASRETAG